MPRDSWNPEQYLKFGDLRTRPARDLAHAVAVADPRWVVDLGCGPGNSTAVCRERWPGASVLGVDRSDAMIEKARVGRPDGDWQVADIGEWSRMAGGRRFDVIFSNAALQWVADHATLFPRLLDRLAPEGALAVQMPAYEMPPNRLMRELAADLGLAVEAWRSHSLDFYYETLRPHAARLDLWATEYVQVMADVEEMVEWYKGTALRPHLEAIGDDAGRARFLAELTDRLRQVYPASQSGGVLFPFRRVFIVAYAPAG
ncbi:MAG: methyltransferase domain-containing protein [Acidobacteria bacterium]|nr:methyltransferase domain-containing protein [Acidobacteriota bacterium]